MAAPNQAGRLAACEFRGACDALAAAWQRHGGHGAWRWRDAPPSPLRASAAARLLAPGWLELQEHLVRAAPAVLHDGIAEGSGAGADAAAVAADEEDDAAALPAAPVTWHRYTLAVAFHASYAVPWLLLRGAGPGGAPLAWQAVLADLAPRLGAAAELPPPGAPPLAGAFGALTPCEHPLTGEVRPACYLPRCASGTCAASLPRTRATSHACRACAAAVVRPAPVQHRRLDGAAAGVTRRRRFDERRG